MIFSSKVKVGRIFFRLLSLVIIYIFFKTILPTLPEPFNRKHSICNLKNTSIWIQNYGEFNEIRSYSKGSVNDETRVEIDFIDLPDSELYFLCKTYIPLLDLYRARNINMGISSTSDVKVRVGLYDSMQTGPAWEYVDLKASDKLEHISHSLDRPGHSKIEWLIRPYEYIPIFIKGYGKPEKLTVTIYDIYLD